VSGLIGMQEDAPAPWREDEFLDQYEVPFGSWIDAIVDWVDQDMEDVIGFDLLGIIEYPFSFMFRNFVDGNKGEYFWKITEMGWLSVCILFFAIGTLVRNVKIGLFASGSLFVCGLLGPQYWEETALTLGLVIVAVVMCALIGIPLGILCGRVDSVWEVVRPMLDAMQVVHSFVYMLPVIFFFSLGNEPATIVTMVFAIPPLIRLTNLGIRQVPEDVVEASRAYGAPEWRVLFDVQLPLARQAIMTGLNQTLLLSVSMLGIAALMGAGGLGKLVFQAVTQLSVPKAASAGLALFIVAVVLDRITQPQQTDGKNLASRIVQAWSARRNPEVLLASSQTEEDTETETQNAGKFTPLGSREQLGAVITAAGAAIIVLSTLLTWSEGPGRISAWGRRIDASLTDTANGLSATGGSWFGLIALISAGVILASVAVSFTRPGTTGRFLGPDGSTFAAVIALATTAAFVMLNEPPVQLEEHSLGSGGSIGIAGALIALVGAVIWLFGANYTASTPLRAKISVATIVMAGFCVLWAGLGGYATWSLDARTDSVITAELQAEIDEVRRQADDGEIRAGIAAQQIQNIVNRAKKTEPTLEDGFSSSGPGLAPVIVLLSLGGLVASLGAAGVFGLEEQKRWRYHVLMASAGSGIIAVALAWTISVMRASDAGFTAGPGVLLAIITGTVFIALARSTMVLFRRSKVFASDQADLDAADEPEATDAVLAPA